MKSCTPKGLTRTINGKPSKDKTASWLTFPSLLVACLALGACSSNGFRSSSSKVNRPQEPKVETSAIAPKTEPEPKAEPGAIDSTAANESPAPKPAPTETEGNIPAELDTSGADDSSWTSLETQRESFLDSILSSVFSNNEPSEPQSRPEAPRCTIETTQAKQQLDVVFNIDVSTSMNSVIEAVKLNVAQFAQALELQSKDVRIASVGFVDAPVLSIGFTDAETFRSKVSQWTTLDLGNRTFQEGGQESLEHALWMLGEFGRPGASYVLVHISDAIIFAPGNESDFTTDQLGQIFGTLKNQFPEFAFFDSVPSSPGRIGANQSIQLSPRDQMDSLRNHAGGLLGQSLAFPFNSASLTTELPNLINKTITQEVCESR